MNRFIFILHNVSPDRIGRREFNCHNKHHQESTAIILEPISGAVRGRAARHPVVSYCTAAPRSPRAFAAADSLPFEIHGDSVGPGVRRPHGLQGPAKIQPQKHEGEEEEEGKIKTHYPGEPQGHSVTLSFREITRENKGGESFQLEQI